MLLFYLFFLYNCSKSSKEHIDTSGSRQVALAIMALKGKAKFVWAGGVGTWVWKGNFLPSNMNILPKVVRSLAIL